MLERTRRLSRKGPTLRLMGCLFGIVMLTACSSEEPELSLTASLGTTYFVSSSEPAGCDFSTKTFTTTPTV